MLVGVNLISPHTVPIIQQLIEEGVADFCEVMVDNFAHLPAAHIRQVFPNVPLSLHMVASRFLEKSSKELNELSRSLRPWISALKPLYVSDHLARFTDAQGKNLPFTAELCYREDYVHIKQRIDEWQTLLETPLLFENYASLSEIGKDQVNFFEKILKDTQARMLFDFSNAYIAERNQVCLTHAWDKLIQQTRHFHVAGFDIDAATQLAIDTHDTPISDAVLQIIRQQSAVHESETTIVVEFDANIQLDVWRSEIMKIKKAVSSKK